MLLTRLKLRRFKRISEVQLDLADINVLVGGNNSGKSSVIQGIHFFVIAAVAQREAGRATFPQEDLLFCPARDFVSLRHGGGFKNQSNFAYLDLEAEAAGEGSNAPWYEIKIYRGRNLGNVGCERRGSPELGLRVADPNRLFSIYVPGLAGIPRSEEYRTEAVVRRSVASGDANLYLRNVLLLIQEKGKTQSLVEWVRRLYPEFELYVEFDPKRDLYLDVNVSVSGPSGRRFPLELAGTGLLQTIQIFAYVTLFEPSLLLLDEPDAHLHPNNQGFLADALSTVVEARDTRVLISTHSRYFVDALTGTASFVWMQDGRIKDQGRNLERVGLLMDLGALDTFDRLAAGEVDYLLLCEDANPELFRVLATANGLKAARSLFWSYRSSSRLSSAIDIAAFVREMAPGTKVIIHRDRDFMTDEEVQRVEARIGELGAKPFITKHSDLEGYFVQADHVAAVLDESPDEVQEWLDELAQANHNELMRTFMRKRDDIGYHLYKKRGKEPPSAGALLGSAVPLASERRLGKSMMKFIRANVHDRFGRTVNVIVPTEHLREVRLSELLTSKE